MSPPAPVRWAEVDGVPMAYREAGSGDPLVLIHGNPTSSYLWRQVMPELTPLRRCIAVDLLGMGASGKLPSSGAGSYRLADHRRYLAGLLAALGVSERVVIVGHDWGAVLGIDWARTNPAATQGIAYLETLTYPRETGHPNAPDPGLFGPLRGPSGERLVLEENLFIEVILPAGTSRPFTDAEMDSYRAPFVEPGESRRPMLSWAREIPLDGSPADVHETVVLNAEFMAASPVPKLFINGDPGALLTGPNRELCRSWPDQVEVTVPGLHFLPEDSPGPIAAALAGWVGRL